MDSRPDSNKRDKHALARQALIFALLGWPTADLAVTVGLLISGTARASVTDSLKMLFQVGLIGMLAGFTVWSGYVLIRSAMKQD